jgi:hypothetical protein
MMHAARILTVIALLGCVGGSARADAGRDAMARTTSDRVTDSRVFLLSEGQTIVDLARPFIIPLTDSVTVDGRPLRRGDDYRINTLRGSIVLVKPASGGETLVARFARYPLPFSYVFTSRVAAGQKAPAAEGVPAPVGAAKERRAEEPYQLRLTGSKTVGVSIGSNKDLGIDQSLKVTMVGKVAKDLEVNAFLTDDNFPIQPEGNTEELKYLDRVYVQVKSRHANVQLGDFSSTLAWSRFSAFQRELRGALANVDAAGQSFMAGGGITKGRFKTVRFQGREGVQGPYELLPAQRFNGVVVLAGTERVYLNGRLLKRGGENDYTIDYSRGAITFVERVPMTNDSEIVVDFEISQDNFERTTLLGGWTSSPLGGAVGLRAFFLQEADDPDKPVSGTLSASDRAILRTAGDDTSRAFSSGIERVEHGKGEYVLVPADSLPARFEFVETGGDYRLQFYEVAAGTGDYRTDGFSTRGIVKYRYTGVGKGDFRIGRYLPLPERLRLFTLGANAAKGAFFVSAEGNVSLHDKNILSGLGDGDNAGGALSLEGGVKDVEIPAAKLQLAGEFSSLDDRFTSPDKPRAAFYYRDWGLEDLPLVGRENTGGVRIGIKGDRPWYIDGSYLSLSRGASLSARKADGSAGVGAMDYRGLTLKGFSSSAGEERKRRFAQGSGVFSFWHLAPLLTLESERFEVQSTTSADTARYYSQGIFSLAGRDIGPYRASLSLTRRMTDLLDSTRTVWQHARDDDEIDFDGGYSAGGRIVELLFTHRRDREVVSEETTSNNLARVRARDSWENAGIAADVGYRIGSGEERTREQAVIFVGENQGDYDQEGREVGQKRGAYMLVYLPGADSEPVRTVELSMQVSAGAGVRGIGGEQGDGGFLGRLRREVSLDHFFSVLEKSRTGDLFGLYTLRPSLLQRNDVTVYGANKLREECTLFNSSNVFKLRLTYSREDEEDNRSEGLAIDAFDRELRIRAESAPLPSLAMSWEFGSSLRMRSTGSLFEQNYRVESLSGSQILTYRANPSTRLSFELGAENRDDAVSSAKQISYMATPSVTSSLGEDVSAAASIRFTYTDVASDTGKPLFFLEQGMREDWSLTGQYRLSRNVSFGLNYTGRREKDYAGEVKTVHDLKMESRAYF